MRRSFLSLACLALAAPAATGAQVNGMELAQLTIRERVTIRVPRLQVAEPVQWKEKKGPRCIAAQSLAGALVSRPGAVDLVLAGGKRVRAKLDGDCEPLDYYAGFYLRPASDGQICADRDVIRTRSGMSCEIDVFRTLVPQR